MISDIIALQGEYYNTYMDTFLQIESLLKTVYIGTSTQAVKQAEQRLRKLLDMESSISVIEQIIEKNSDTQLKQAAKCMMYSYFKQKLDEGQITSELPRLRGHYIKVDNIIHNNQVNSSDKYQVVNIYVRLNLLYEQECTKRVISKVNYYFRTNQYELAFIFLNAFLDLEHRLSPRAQLYKFILPLLAQFVKQGQFNQQSHYQLCFQSLCNFIVQLNFPCHQSLVAKLLSESALSGLIQQVMSQNYPQKVKEYNLRIIQKILKETLRIGCLNEFPAFASMLLNLLQKQLPSFILQACQSKIFEETELTYLQIYSMLLEHHLCKIPQLHHQGLKVIFLDKVAYLVLQRLTKIKVESLQIYAFFQDLCFFRQSQCPEVIYQRFVHSLCEQIQIVSLLRYVLLSFLCSMPQINIPIKTQCLELEAFLLGVCVYEQYLQLEAQFLSNLKQFLQTNFLNLIKSEGLIKLYSILLFGCYGDYLDNEGSLALIVMQELFESLSNDQLVAQFAIHVLMNHCRIPGRIGQQKLIQITISTYLGNNQIMLLPLIKQFLRNYPYTLDKLASKLMELTMRNLSQSSSEYIINTNFQLLEEYFQHNFFTPLFDGCLSSLKQILCIRPMLLFSHQSSIISLLNLFMKWMKYLPNGYGQVISHLSMARCSKQIIDCLNLLIIYCPQNQKSELIVQLVLQRTLLYLINKHPYQLTEKVKIQVGSILLLHTLIIYHIERFNQNMLGDIVHLTLDMLQKDNEKFNYTNGKHQLTLVLLLSYDFKKTTMVLRKLNVQEKTYRIIYGREYQYRVEYDGPILVKMQLKILQQAINYEMQLRYATMSFQCVVWALQRIFLQQQNNLTNQDNNQLYFLCFEEETKVEKEFRSAKQIISNFICHPDLTEIDELDIFRQFITRIIKHPSSKCWYQAVKAKLQRSTQENLNKILQTYKVRGTYRQMKKIQMLSKAR